MKIGEQIRLVRKNKNLSQEQLAQQLNVTRQAVYKWESGKGYPDIQNLIMLSELFEVSIDELIKGDSSFQRKIKVKGGTGMFSDRRLLSSLNYFSLFFAPFFFPFITMMLGSEDMKQHGKRAFISHSLPVVAFLFMMMIFYLSAYTQSSDDPASILVVISMTLLVLITISVVIWNIVQGVKQLRS